MIKTYEEFLSESVTSDKKEDLWIAFTNLVDGLDGVISEEGELPSSYWKGDVEERINKYNDHWSSSGKNITDKDIPALKQLVDDMFDGIDGYESEKGGMDRYFKSGVLSNIKKLVGYTSN